MIYKMLSRDEVDEIARSVELGIIKKGTRLYRTSGIVMKVWKIIDEARIKT